LFRDPSLVAFSLNVD
jgi:hypothetical protein